MIVLPATPLVEARAAASRLCRKIGGKGFVVPGHDTPISVTISIGVTMGGAKKTPESLGGADPNSLLDAADKALYAAKLQGRNQFNLGRPAA
jgi:two-component system cell cycle response regulator